MLKSVSIIINNYNYARFLRRAIESALAQTHPAVEVIIVDDGSTDDSGDIIGDFEGRATVIRRRNAGQGAAVNAGFAASRGEIVMILDSDDALKPEAVATVVEAWRPGTAKAQFHLDWVDADDRPLGRRWTSTRVRPEDVHRHLLSTGTYPSPPMSGNAFCRRVLERILPVPEASFRLGADGYLSATAAVHGPVLVIDRVLGDYRIHGDNHSEIGGLDLKLIRRFLHNNVARDEAVRRMAGELGLPAAHCSSLNLPLHCRNRLLSIKLEPETHPFPGDRPLGLAGSGIAAAWRMPGLSPARRAGVAAHFAVLGLLPRWLVRRYLPFVVSRRAWQDAFRRPAASPPP
jgi:glycosyltransferase involved in cell wall biosynthesis